MAKKLCMYNFSSGSIRKRVLLLAVSCKNGGLCPGGIDLDNPDKWIRIVRDDGVAGAVQGHDIDFAKPLDVIEFDGRPMPQGKQKENWVIDGHSCRKIRSEPISRIIQAYNEYGYKGFWNNTKAYLNEEEFASLSEPSESIMIVSDVRLYYNEYRKAKIDFSIRGLRYPILGVSLTDPDFYDKLELTDIHYKYAVIIVSIPKEADWCYPQTGEKRGYKFVSKVFGFDDPSEIGLQ